MKTNIEKEAEEIIVKAKPYGKRAGIIAIGWLVNNTIIDNLFDYALYPFVIWKLGLLWGGITMTILSFLACWLTMIFYDWSKKDWLGIETIKGIKEYKGRSKIEKFIAWILKKGDFVSFIFLSVYFDPFITTAYMRRGSNRYDGMKKRDWRIFIASGLFSNIWWTLVSFGGVSVIEWAWGIV